MKKIFLFILLIITITLTGCSSSNLKNISIKELNEKIEAKETFVVYFTSKNDNNLEKKLVSVLEENNVVGYKVNINKISNEEKLALQTNIDYADPSIIFVIEGADPGLMSHVDDVGTSKDELVNRLKDMKFIKE